MNDNQIVSIEMLNSERLKLDNQIYNRMERLGLLPRDYDKLELGFHLPVNWPLDKDCEITLPQLVVLANKLKMKIVIGDLDLTPMPEKPKQ